MDIDAVYDGDKGIHVEKKKGKGKRESSPKFEGSCGRFRKSARITTQSAEIDRGDEQGDDLRTSRRKLHHHRWRTFSLRGSVAPGRCHWYSVYSFTATAEREIARNVKRNCATSVWITTLSSSRMRKLTRKRPTSSQTETSALSVLIVSVASKCCSSRFPESTILLSRAT